MISAKKILQQPGFCPFFAVFLGGRVTPKNPNRVFLFLLT